MCQPSVVAPDWIGKGCHIKVNGIELAVRPDHRGGVVFRSVFSRTAFSRTADKALNAAVRVATEECLTDPDVRSRWIRQIQGAMVLMVSETGALRELATSRLAELHFLLVALRKYRE